jgi:predicted dehydrogenase/nucleoside-diphosphate-sugar epimerase
VYRGQPFAQSGSLLHKPYEFSTSMERTTLNNDFTERDASRLPASILGDARNARRLRVVIIGAGYIAPYHLEVLRQLDRVDVVGACDPDRARLDDLCRTWGIPIGAVSLGDLLRRCQPDVAHVLVPPPLHFEVGRDLLAAGVHVLLEKPMAVKTEECLALIDLARAKGLRVAVNHNAVFHPAFQRLLAGTMARKLGRIEHVVSINNLSLAQLDSGEHTHWMFREPVNILLEQATHPLSQICKLLGDVRDATVVPAGARVLSTGTTFYSRWQMALTCERGTAQLFIAFGRSQPTSTVHIVGEDATARIDLLNNTYVLDRSTKYLKPVDQALRSAAEGSRVMWDGGVGFLNYVLSTLRIRTRTDPYYVSMLKSIEAFYRSFDDSEATLQDGTARVGLQVVAASEKAIGALKLAPPFASRPQSISRPIASERREGQVLVLGGSGFIGRRLVAALAHADHPVRVLSRRAGAPRVGRVRYQPQVQPGDIRNADDVARAAEGCRSVIHLVSGAPADWSEYERLFVEGTRHVAEACLRSGAEQLLFASSIAAYDLGHHRTITESTPLDDHPKRADYTKAKVACERLLTRMHEERGLPITIFRPGVVVGAGGPVEHLGVGFWPTPTHCVSWGSRVDSPLPFVLVDDVVAAFVAAIGRPGLVGQSFNLVGDVRLSAAEYLDALREASGRHLQLHRQSLAKWYSVEIAKWIVKALARKRENVFPSYHDIASRSLRAPFDCTRAKQMLDWRPVSDRARFIELGIWQALEDTAT